MKKLCALLLAVTSPLSATMDFPSNLAKVSATFDFLFWKVARDGLNYTHRVKPADPNDFFLINLKAKEVHPDWEWGYRTGLGYEWDLARFETRLTWMHHATHQREHAVKNPSTLEYFKLSLLLPRQKFHQPFNSVSPEAVSTHVEAEYNFKIDQIDLFLTRPLLLLKNFTLHPFFGVRGVSIRENMHAFYKDVLRAMSQNEPLAIPAGSREFFAKSNFWGVGPVLGSELVWHISTHMSLSGKASAALYWGEDELEQKGKGEDPTLDSEMFARVMEYNREARTRAQVDLGIFLNWENATKEEAYFYQLSAGYEALYSWQKRLPPSQLRPQACEDFSLRGLTIRGRLNF